MPRRRLHVLPLGACVDLAAHARALEARPGLCWLDGEADHADANWSFVGADPVEWFNVPWSEPEPLRALERQIGREPAERESDVDPGLPGLSLAEVPHWIGYIAYDACHAAGQVRLQRSAAQPVLAFARYDALVALNHRTGQAYIVGDDAESCGQLHTRLRTATTGPCTRPQVGSMCVTPADQHCAAIERALEHMAAGDIYQVNLARCWSAPYAGPALPLWSALRAASPVPFGFYFDDLTSLPTPPGTRVIMARTMERFVRFRRDLGQLMTRPIKGTLARVGDRDGAEAATLRADPKERAEHAMIVDLMRNDLGRVAVIGSVHVPEAFAIEPFAGLSHMVSTIACRTRPEVGLRDVLEATFPPGSVTGAPKRRAIQIIEQLEAVPRDVYTGAVGFIDRCGGLSLAVAIRTAVIDRGQLRYFAGGGIVEASNPEREVAETELKARVLVDALHSRAFLG